MGLASVTSDEQLLAMLRRSDGLSVAQLVEETGVTATAVRQRLNRLMDEGLVERAVTRHGRGRPSHRYVLTDKARRKAGSNFADLAVTLWNEIRAVQDPDVRRGLLKRVAEALAKQYEAEIGHGTRDERLAALRRVFADRGVDIVVEEPVEPDQAPVLTILDCPYPGLAEQDRGICAVEKMLFSDLLDDSVRLTQCRLEGHGCCQFQGN